MLLNDSQLIIGDAMPFGTNPEQEYLELSKALESGGGTDSSLFQGGRALIREDLDFSLYSALHSSEDAPLFRMLKKDPTRSPIAEWTRNDDVGSDDGAYTAERGKSKSSVRSKYQRVTVPMAYIQFLREVSTQIQNSNTISEPLDLEISRGILQVIRVTETGMFNGRRDTNPLAFDGLASQIQPENTFDFRGGLANSAAIEKALKRGTRTVRKRFGRVTHGFFTVQSVDDFNDVIADRIRFNNQEATSGTTKDGNLVFTNYPTPNGRFAIIPDVFNSDRELPRASTLIDERPLVPTAATAATAADATSLFDAVSAGAYKYQVAFINPAGEGPALDVAGGADVTPASGEKVTFTVSLDAGSPEVTGIRVYRTAKGAADTSGAKLAFEVPVSGTPASFTDAVDRNFDLPGCGDIFLLDMRPMIQAIKWFNFLPVRRLQMFPTQSAVNPFLIVQYGSLALTIPQFHFRIKNVNTTANLDDGFSF